MRPSDTPARFNFLHQSSWSNATSWIIYRKRSTLYMSVAEYFRHFYKIAQSDIIGYNAKLIRSYKLQKGSPLMNDIIHIMGNLSMGVTFVIKMVDHFTLWKIRGSYTKLAFHGSRFRVQCSWKSMSRVTQISVFQFCNGPAVDGQVLVSQLLLRIQRKSPALLFL